MRQNGKIAKHVLAAGWISVNENLPVIQHIGWRYRVRQLAANGSGIAEGRDLEAECFNLAQMPNRSTNDC